MLFLKLLARNVAAILLLILSVVALAYAVTFIDSLLPYAYQGTATVLAIIVVLSAILAYIEVTW